jgi:hypothetical protein
MADELKFVVHWRENPLFALNHLFNEEEEIDRDVIGRMLKFPGTAYRFIGKRNWLSLEPDLDRPEPRIWANWYVEGESKPYIGETLFSAS